MKKLLIVFFLLTFLFFPTQASGNGDLTVDQVIGEIISAQGVSDKTQVDCQRVTADQFERLGGAVMGLMHPDEQERHLMDEMMGGEGGEGLSSLRNAHIVMGKRYLSCSDGGVGGLFSMTRGGMMSMMRVFGQPYSGQGIMGGWTGNWLFGLTHLLGFLTWIVFLIFLLLGIVYFWQQIKKGKKKP